MIVLALETSTPLGSVALIVDGEVVFAEEFQAGRTHGAALFDVLERMQRRSIRFDRIAVGLGPGSYSGVRIAIATATGLAIATGVELAGLPSVCALDVSPPHYAVIGDARRAAFYFARVENRVCVDGPALLDAAELRAKLDEAALSVYAPAPIMDVPEAQIAFPSAVVLAKLALRVLPGNTACTALEPIYLREPITTQPKAHR